MKEKVLDELKENNLKELICDYEDREPFERCCKKLKFTKGKRGKNKDLKKYSMYQTIREI